MNPCGDPPGGAGAYLAPADGRGRGAAQPGPAHRRPTRSTLDGTVIRGRPGHRRRRGRQPAGHLPRDPNARRIIAYGFRNPFRFTDPAGDRARSGSATSAGTPGRRSTGSIAPRRPAAELRLALLRGSEPRRRATTPPTSTSARTCTPPAGAVDRAVPCLRPQQPRSCPARRARSAAPRSPGSQFDSPPAALLPRRVRRRALLRRLLARLHLGHADGRRRPARHRASSGPSSPARPIPVDLEVGPGGDLFYVDFDGGTIRRIRYQSRATSRRPRWPRATPTTGPAAAAR